MFTTGNEIVDKVGMINLEGNIIPHAWYQRFKMPNGKPDLNAMIILSEIVYWYRPSTARDETTGQVTGIKKKFKADLLQRSYESFAIQFGLTKRQVKEAIDRLCVHGVIWKEFRTVNVNIKLNNVLFIGINTDVLCSVSVLQAHTLKSNTLLRSNVTPSNDKTSNPTTLDSETNTDITTGTTTGISTDTGEKQQQQKKPKKVKPKLEKPSELNQQLWDDLIRLRKQKKQPLTYSAWHDAKYNLAQLQLGVSQGHTMNDMVGVWLLRGWQGFKFEWYLNHVAKENQSQNTQGNHNAINQPTFGKSAAELYAEKLTNQLAEQHPSEFAPVAPTGVGYDYQ